MRYIGKGVKLGKNVETGFGAYIEDGTKIGNNVRIGPFAQILSGSVLEDNCIVGGHCVIGHPSKLQLQKTDFSATSPRVTDFIVKEAITQIGEGSIIRSGSTIYTHVIVGKKLRTGHNVIIREHVTIGDNCIVGTQAILDGYIKIGNKSMIQSQCYIAQSVKVGKGVFIAPSCVILDNKKIILGKGLEGPSIGDYVRIGAGSKILPGITIGGYALIGAGSIVTKDIPTKAIAYGVPTKTIRFQNDQEIEAYVKSVMTWE